MKLPITIALVALAFTQSHVDAAIIHGPFTNASNGHIYYLLSSNTWAKAEAEAVNLGGHLVTINDAAEQTWITNTFLGLAGTHAVWIGLTDRDVEGTFQWISGETSAYRNWDLGEPNNSGGADQDYVHLIPANTVVQGRAVQGKWNDLGTDQGTNYNGIYAIAEIVQGEATTVSIIKAVEIGWPTQTTNRYQIEWSSSLDTNDWFSLGPEIQGTGSTNYYFDSTRGADKRFYRVRTIKP